MNRHLEGGSADYSKMTKAELIEALNLAYLDISALEDINAEFLNSTPTYRPGWWIGVALFAAILVPWVLFGIWVMS